MGRLGKNGENGWQQQNRSQPVCSVTRAQVGACEVIVGLKSALALIRRGIKQEALSAE